jgi:hypothetical protein
LIILPVDIDHPNAGLICIVQDPFTVGRPSRIVSGNAIIRGGLLYWLAGSERSAHAARSRNDCDVAVAPSGGVLSGASRAFVRFLAAKESYPLLIGRNIRGVGIRIIRVTEKRALLVKSYGQKTSAWNVRTCPTN